MPVDAIKPRVEEIPHHSEDTSPYRWDIPAPAPGIPQAGAAQPPAILPPTAELSAILPPTAEPPAILPPAPVPEAPPMLPSPPPINLTAPPMAAAPQVLAPASAMAPQPMAFPTVAGPAPASPTLEAPPVPALGPGMPTPSVLPPMTMAFSAGAAAAPAVPEAGTAEGPAAGPTTQEVLAKLAKPKPAPTAPRRKRASHSKAFLIVIGLAAAGLLGSGWFFLFRDTKGLKTAVSMDSGRAPVGGEVADDSASAQKPPAGAPPAQTPPAQPQPPAQAATAPAPTAPPGPATSAPSAPAQPIRDERPAAIELVKNFPLDGDRSTVVAWLQYSFAASPGAQPLEKWDAGAVEESTYLVQYTVQPSGQNLREAITYLFEADTARKTVRGKNPAALELLAGGSRPKAKPVRSRPRARKRAVRRPPAPAAPKVVPLLPLPSDADLLPPAEDDSAFRSDTVQPNL